MNYKEKQEQIARKLLKEYFKDPGYGLYFVIDENKKRIAVEHELVLKKSQNNLFLDIQKTAEDYFKKNNITWWNSVKFPSGHLLSSQISCINHLFHFRNDKDITTGFLKKIDKKTLKEIEELKKNLQENENGAGLAAPQIGVNKNFFGIKEKGGVRILINPKLTAFYGEKLYPKMVDNEGKESDFLEGCLSFPDLFGTVKRYLRIEAEWEEVKNQKLETKHKTMEGFEAILWQHEYDHLLGVLFVDHIKEEGGQLYLWRGKEKKKINVDKILKKEK